MRVSSSLSRCSLFVRYLDGLWQVAIVLFEGARAGSVCLGFRMKLVHAIQPLLFSRTSIGHVEMSLVDIDWHGNCEWVVSNHESCCDIGLKNI